MPKYPQLETERLILREFTLSDATFVQRLAGDFEIADTTLNIPHPYKDGLAEKWILEHKEIFIQQKGTVFAITLKDNQQLVGSISLLNINKVHRHAELGYWIAKDFWNRGYATEAGKAVVLFGFNNLDLNRIFAHHISRNPASGKVLEKIGMIHEGTQRQHVKKWNKFEDIELYAILKPDLKY